MRFTLVSFFYLHHKAMSHRKSEPASIDNPESWVDSYGDFLYRFALSRVKDPSVAEDLVQETFLAALRARENFKGESAGRTWLIAILKHKIVDHIRKRVREPIRHAIHIREAVRLTVFELEERPIAALFRKAPDQV